MGKIIIDDALHALTQLESESVDVCVTSPPYYNLRDYEANGQIGTESSPQEYIDRLVDIFHEVKRVLKPDGTLWIVIGDSYAGSGKGRTKNGVTKEGTIGKVQTGSKGTWSGTLYKTEADGCKPKDLIGIPWMLAFALRADGWYLRSDIIWDKSGNVFPESVKDRCTKSHEYIFMLSKSKKYYYDYVAVREPVCTESLKRAERAWHGKGSDGSGNYAGLTAVEKMGSRFVNSEGRNKRDVWHINTQPYGREHFAAFPPELIRPCILAGSKVGGVVLDPFVGSGTTAMVALQEGRDYIGIDIQPRYEPLIRERLATV